MGLSTYRKKRSFDVTPEPQGGKGDLAELRFVVQKHDASRLHYDFRLEIGGVLKSWAIPKGPSLNPEDKRLAMMVEDHPFDYRNFEGVIPEGNYGAGTVIVWDEGAFEPLEPTGSKTSDEKLLLKALKAGSLKFSLHGHKLKGEFALVKLKKAENNAWLLIKHRDEYANETDVTRKDKSVISKKTIEQMAKNPAKVYGKAAIKATTGITKKAAKKFTKKSSSSKSALKKLASKAPSRKKSANRTPGY